MAVLGAFVPMTPTPSDGCVRNQRMTTDANPNSKPSLRLLGVLAAPATPWAPDRMDLVSFRRLACARCYSGLRSSVAGESMSFLGIRSLVKG